VGANAFKKSSLTILSAEDKLSKIKRALELDIKYGHQTKNIEIFISVV
jgi:hypothetical protein